MYDLSSRIPAKIRVLTDSFEAIQELQRPHSTDPYIHQIITQINVLHTYGTQIRIDWTPGHESSSPGNQAAHAVAQEAHNLPTSVASHPMVQPALEPSATLSETSLPPALRIHRYKKAKKLRLQQLTPTDHITPLAPLNRSAEIFMNKLFANASYAPETFRKWYNPTMTPKCPYCQLLTPADLQHLTWYCPKFTRYRNFLPPTSDSITPIDPYSLDKPTLLAIAEFAIKSGLARAT